MATAIAAARLADGIAREFLGALDTAAEAARTRALLLVDALNEGAGAKLWRAEIAEFLQQVHRYPNIAIALTCRSEYVQ